MNKLSDSEALNFYLSIMVTRKDAIKFMRNDPNQKELKLHWIVIDLIEFMRFSSYCIADALILLKKFKDVCHRKDFYICILYTYLVIFRLRFC